MAKILKSTDENISMCGELIRKGELVAFPTETVYGLGANALDFNSVLKIYETKQRPLTDPVIVHVDTLEKSFDLINPTQIEMEIYKFLADQFWPGPLTMVLRKSDKIHIDMTAKTGFVGIRIPNHKTALQFIRESDRPIAAPSANVFNHVSPTTASHVFNDFFDKLNGGITFVFVFINFYDHFLQVSRAFFHFDIDNGLFTNFDFLIFETYERKNQNIGFLNVDFERTCYVRQDAFGRAFYDDVNTDERLAIRICDDTRNGLINYDCGNSR